MRKCKDRQGVTSAGVKKIFFFLVIYQASQISKMILKLTRLINDRVASCVMLRQKIVIMTICICILSGETVATPEVIWSVNAGGEAHTDAHGIR